MKNLENQSKQNITHSPIADGKNLLKTAYSQRLRLLKELNPHYSCLGPAFKIYVEQVMNVKSWCWHILNSHYSSLPQFHVLPDLCKLLEHKQSSV